MAPLLGLRLSIVLLPLFVLSALVRLSENRAALVDKPSSSSHSLSFPLTPLRLPRRPNPHNSLSPLSRTTPGKLVSSFPPTPPTYKSSFTYSMVLTISLPVGTPPQSQRMILDTGSQLSWIQCHNDSKASPKKESPPSSTTTNFEPSLSSSFSPLLCDNSLCTPEVPDYTLPTSCDHNKLCHYSYFYADGTLAEGNLVKEHIPFASATPPLVLGCAARSSDDKGILGMNLGRLSFASQAKVTKFSYCVPGRTSRTGQVPTGSFYLGDNPSSGTFQYISLLSFGKSHSQSMPNFDPLAYTIAMQGIRIGNQKLNIPPSIFVPDAGGSGQTMIDSGSEFSYLVDEAYDRIREEVVRVAGQRMKQGYSYEGGVADICFEGDPVEIEKLIGEMAFEFEKGLEVVIPKERILADVEGGVVHCLAIGRSSMLGSASNIIGNFHQQNLWVEFDLTNRRVGFGKADCGLASS